MKKGSENADIFVFVARFPYPVDNEKIVPPERAEEIESCSNAKARNEKFYAWKLLEEALLRTFGLRLDGLDIKRTESGKWVCTECFFSLSHSGNLVAVAVSKIPVGVDIERRDLPRFTPVLAEKITTGRERGDLSAQTLNALWTKKEAIFKLSGGKAFIPKNIETADYSTVTKFFDCDGEGYFISVASESAEKAVFYGLN